MAKGFTFTVRPRVAVACAIGTLAGVTAWVVSAASNPVAAGASVAGDKKSAAAWHAVPGGLMTRFASTVRPDNVRTEYPRPQFARKDWLSLNGLWEFGFDDANKGEAEKWYAGKPFAEHILVPFPFEAALSGIGRGNEVHERVWYRRTFEAPKAWTGKRLLLNFGAVDWEATVYVNGKQVGQHRGGYAPFSVDITDALRPDGAQELVVQVYDPSEKNPQGWQPRGKQKGSEGIWYTRTTGIWQTVWLEPVADAHLSNATITPTLGANDKGTVAISAFLPTSANGLTLNVRLKQGATEVGTATTTVTGGMARVSLAVPNAKPWTPETPTLYDVSLQLSDKNGVVDAVNSYTAIRSVGIANGRLTLNGKPYFYRGVLDQGFWPDGIYTPPSDDAIRADVEAVRKLGFNMARKHIKLDDPRWYYWCDRLGVAVWQDMPSPDRLDSPQAQDNYRREWTDIIETARSYPCIVHWIPFNENWGNPGAFQDEMVDLTRRLDATRPITDASGWTQRDKTDVIDSHNYGANLLAEGVSNPVKPKVIGEFGGVGLRVDGHSWEQAKIYLDAPDTNQLVNLVRARVSQTYQAENLSGFVYTQLTDVEHELNGLLTYDRLPKAPMEAMAPVIRGEGVPRATQFLPVNDWLVLDAVPSHITMNDSKPTKEATEQMDQLLGTAYLPDEAGLTPKVGASVKTDSGTYMWKRVQGTTLDFQKLLPGGPHNNAVTYAAAWVDSPRAVSDAVLHLASDDGAVVWLNGRQVLRKAAIRGVDAEADEVSNLSLKAGRNLLVVKVGQGVGGWGLSARLHIP